ncbi:MAG: hypothetical protein ACK2UW_09300, partial [Anaerolineales bacterium]
NATVAFRDVALDGNDLGDFEGVWNSTLTWHVKGEDLSSGFTLTGNIVLENFNPAGVNEHNKVDIGFGWTDLVGPVTSQVQVVPNLADLGDTVALTAHVDDTGTGNSNIASAEYAFDSGTWNAMIASDGVFNSPIEDVEMAVQAPMAAGAHALCVRGTDSAGSTGDPACTTLTVTDNLPPTTGSLQFDPASPNVGQTYTMTLPVTDVGTGSSNIVSGEFRLGSGGWQPMAAWDGSFDSPVELLAATPDAPPDAGTYQVCARATDAAGFTSLPTCADLVVLDNLAPTTGSLLLEPASLNLGEPYTLTLDVSDLTTGASVIITGEFQLDTTGWTPLAASDGSFDSVEEQLTGNGVAPTDAGTYPVCARATDAADNTSLEACADLEVLDNLPPTAGSLVFDPALPGLNAPLTVTAMIDDAPTGNSPIDTAEFSLDGGSTWQLMAAADGSFDSATESVQLVRLSPSEAGDYNACVRGADTAGNTSSMICATLSVVDDLPPETVLLTAEPTESGYTVTASADDTLTGGSSITGAEVSLDGGSWQPLAAADGTFDSPYEMLAGDFTAALEPGSYPVCVRSSDTAGNTSAENCGTLVVPNPEIPDTTGPVVTSLALDPAEPVAGTPFLISAEVDDLSTGGSNIAAISYEVNGSGIWLPMNPADGSFSGPVETGQVELALEQPGTHTVCVRGTDSAENTGEPECTQVTVAEVEYNLFIPVIQRNNP